MPDPDLSDIAGTVPALLDAATVPATIVNWGGAEQVSLAQWCEHLAVRCGYTATFEETESTIGGVTVDLTRMGSITGHTAVAWKDGFDALADAWLTSQP